MCLTRKFQVVGSMLIAAACLFQNSGSAANLPTGATTKAARVQSKLKTKKLPNRIRRPQITGQTGSTAKTAKKGRAALSPTSVQSSATALRITEPKRAKLKQAGSRLAIDPAKLRAAKTVKVDGLKNTGLREVANGAGAVAAGPKDSNFNNIARRAGTIKTQESVENVGANSSTFKAIETAMPGFGSRGANGASSLRDLGSTGGRNKNPVTSAGGLSDFAGGGSDQVSDGPGTHSAPGHGSITHNKDGSSTFTDSNGTTHFYDADGKKSGWVVDKNGEGHVDRAPEKAPPANDGQRQVISIDNPGYDTQGRPIYEIEMGTPKVTSSSKKTKGEPVDDATGSGGSGKPVVTADTLRGLRSRATSKGEPTGDEGTSGGAVDQSKTRQGKIDQVGQPADDSVAVRSAPTSMEVTQALRIRLRNVTPTPR